MKANEAEKYCVIGITEKVTNQVSRLKSAIKYDLRTDLNVVQRERARTGLRNALINDSETSGFTVTVCSLSEREQMGESVFINGTSVWFPSSFPKDTKFVMLWKDSEGRLTSFKPIETVETVNP